MRYWMYCFFGFSASIFASVEAIKDSSSSINDVSVDSYYNHKVASKIECSYPGEYNPADPDLISSTFTNCANAGVPGNGTYIWNNGATGTYAAKVYKFFESNGDVIYACCKEK